MKKVLLSLSFVFFSLSSNFADTAQELRIKKVTQELIQMSPLVQACALLLKSDMPVKHANCIRIIQDFDDVLDELCKLQDELLQEKK